MRMQTGGLALRRGGAPADPGLGGPAVGPARDRLGGREPVPLLSRSGRYRGASRDLGQPAARAAPQPGAVGRARCWQSATPKGGRDHVRQDVLGRHAQPLRLPRSARLHQSQEPRGSRQPARSGRRADRRLHLADGAARPRRARQGRDAALRHAGAAGDALSRRRLDQGRDRRAAGGGGLPRASPISSSSAWATVSPRAKAIPTCRCASRPTARPNTASAPTMRSSTAIPARVGDWKAIGDKAFIEENARWLDQACHRSLYSHQLRAALQLASRTRIAP